MPAPYDLIIHDGRVIDPSQAIDEIAGVAVAGGKVAAISRDMPESGARRVIQARGMVVTPGLIDVHTHVFPLVGPYGIDADPFCVTRGVTTVIDAGTAGALTFPAFKQWCMDHSQTRIRAVLNIAAIGMAAGGEPGMGELEDLRYCSVRLAVEQARAYPGMIAGFKIRVSGQYAGRNDLEGMRRARQAADEAGLPLMVHIGDSSSSIREILALMKPGDIVTHCFNSRRESLLDASGKVRREVLDARERGVKFDVGHGAGSFSFDVAGRCLEQGFLPDTISTDLYAANVKGPVFDLPTTLSKFLMLGMTLPEVIRRATASAAAMFNFSERIGSLAPGSEADVSIFEVCHGRFEFRDTEGQTRSGGQMLAPVVTLRAGKAIDPVE